MKKKGSETYGFTLVAIGLLTGFFLGGSIVYWYSNRTGNYSNQLITSPANTISTPVQSESPINLSHKSNPESRSASTMAEDIKLIKDQMIGIKEFYLPDIFVDQPLSRGSQILDSLMGQNPAKENGRKIFYVEFRESPLNYTAYRMTKNHLVVYGLDQIDFVSLHSFDNQLYLKYFEEYFPLEITADFNPLIPANDIRLINKTMHP